MIRNRQIRQLWYIASIDNLESILTHGILCRDKVQAMNLTFKDISDPSVQRRRASYHDHVPLFFADNTPMLYRVFWPYRENICLLEISNRVLERKDLKFCDGNLASNEKKIYNNLREIPDENWDIIFSRNAAYGIDSKGRNWKSIRAAEVLVPEKVSQELIQSIYVAFATRKAYERTCDILASVGRTMPVYRNLTPQGI